jgi:hypothetical protein
VRRPRNLPDVLAFAGAAATLHLLVHYRVDAHLRLMEDANRELFTDR